MTLDDPELPAVIHLSGPDAFGPLSAAVGRAGGTLHDLQVTHVQYRPGNDIVVRYRCDISWPDGRRPREVLVAAATTAGPLPGAIPVVAHLDSGDVTVSVWRWPFDPVLPGLTTAVTPSDIIGVLHGLDVAVGCNLISVDVVAYRPTERAVVRISHTGGVVYVKVVPPSSTSALADRHRVLRDAGLPVPPVVAADEGLGLVVLDELIGPTLRDRVKNDSGGWPVPGALSELLSSLRALSESGLAPVSDRVHDAFGHAGLLRTVAPEVGPVLDQILDRIRPVLTSDDRATHTVIHGDLHESQLIVADDGAITGLLDIDDLGIGRRLTDPGTLIAHLRFRAVTATDPGWASRVVDYTDHLRRHFSDSSSAADLDAVVAATLVGLATGPFRIQREDWRGDIDAVLAAAGALVPAG